MYVVQLFISLFTNLFFSAYAPILLLTKSVMYIFCASYRTVVILRI